MTSRMSPATIKLTQRYKSDAELLARFNPDMQVVFCRDIEKCFFGEAPSISLVEQAYGRTAAMSWMEIQLNNLSEFAGCKGKLTTAQIAETAAMIVDGYPHFKLTEFMLFFQRFKRCEYGKFYGAVDPMTILQALTTFGEQRARAIEEREAAAEKERQEAAKRANDELRERYRDRVPDAFTPKAPLDFLQYRLLGYDSMSDEQLAMEIADLQSHKKTLPRGARQMLDYLRGAYDIKD